MKQRFEGATPPRRSGVGEIRSILVPIDFSEYSIRSLQYAIAFGRQFGSKLILLTVIETTLPAYDFGTMSPALLVWDTAIKKNTRHKLAQFAQEQIPPGIEYECFAETGDPSAEILHAASVQKVGLIVMATHGRSGLQHMLLGSVAEKTIGLAPCPVLVVRRVQRSFIAADTQKIELRLNQILVPTDFSEDAGRALALSESIASRSDAHLTLLHVVPVHYAVGEYDSLEYPQIEADLMEIGERKLAKLQRSGEQRDLRITTRITRGSPRAEIVAYAEQSPCDIIVMGTRGLTGLKHLILGSTAQYVVQHAPCAVLTVAHSSHVRLVARKHAEAKVPV